jgi:hypothetical protein
MNIVPRLPGVVFNPEVLPLHQITELPVDDFAVQDVFHYPFLFSVDDFRRRRRRCVPSHNWVFRGFSKLDYVEDGVESAHRRRQTEAI